MIFNKMTDIVGFKYVLVFSAFCICFMCLFLISLVVFFFLTLLTSRLLKTCIFDLSKSNIWLFSPLCGCLNSVYFHLMSLSWCYFNSVSFILYIIMIFKERLLDHVGSGLRHVGSAAAGGLWVSVCGLSSWCGVRPH